MYMSVLFLTVSSSTVGMFNDWMERDADNAKIVDTFVAPTVLTEAEVEELPEFLSADMPRYNGLANPAPGTITPPVGYQEKKFYGHKCDELGAWFLKDQANPREGWSDYDTTSNHPEEKQDCWRRAAGHLVASYARSDQNLINFLKGEMARYATNKPADVAKAANFLRDRMVQLRLAVDDAANPLSVRNRLANNMVRALKVMKNTYQQLTTKMEELTALRDTARGQVQQATLDSQRAIARAMSDFARKLGDYDRMMVRYITQQSRLMDLDGLRNINNLDKSMAVNARKLATRLASTEAIRKDFADSVEAKTLSLDRDYPASIAAAQAQMARQANEAANNQIAKLPAAIDRERSKFYAQIASYDKTYNKEIQRMSNVLNTQIDKFSTSRLRELDRLNPALEANITQVKTTANLVGQKARTEFILPAVLSVNQTERELDVMTFKFARDGDLSLFDATKLLNETAVAFQSVIKAYEDDWAAAQRASAGEAASLSQEFINRLSSVGAAIQEELSNVEGLGADLREDFTSKLGDMQMMTSANIGDVNRYMSGTAAHLSEETANMKDLLITKQQDLGASIDFLKSFLLSRVQNANRTFSEAIGDLGKVLGQVKSFVTPEAAQKDLNRTSEFMQMQLHALSMSADVKAESLEALITAAQSGNVEVFNRLFSQIVDHDRALASAVNKNLELAVLTSATLNEANGARKQYLQEQLEKMLSNSTDQVELIRAQAMSQLSVARSALNTLSAQRLNEFKTWADNAVAVATAASRSVGSANATQAIVSVMAPLLVRLDTIRTNLVPAIVSSIDSMRHLTSRAAHNIKDDMTSSRNARSEAALAKLKSEADFLWSNATSRIAARMAAWDTTLAVFKNDTESFASKLPQLTASMNAAIEEMKGVAQAANMELELLQNKVLYSQLSSFVAKSATDETDRLEATRPLMKSAYDSISALAALANQTESDLASFVASAKRKLVEEVSQSTSKAATIQQNFVASVKEFDKSDFNYAKSLTDSEVNALVEAWSSLDRIAPAVNESLKASMPINLRAEISKRLKGVQDLQTRYTGAFNDASASMSGLNVSELFDAITDSVNGAVNGSYLLRDSIFKAYSAFNLSPVATSLQTLGSGIGVAADLSSNLTSQALVTTQRTAAAAKTEADAAASVSRVNSETVARLLSAFAAKSLNVTQSFSDLETEQLSRNATVPAIMTLWKTLYDSAANATDAGYAAMTALAHSSSASIVTQREKNEQFVAEKLSQMRSGLDRRRAILSSNKNSRLTIIDEISKKLATTKADVGKLQADFVTRDMKAVSQIRAFKEAHTNHVTALETAIGNWQHEMTNAVESVIANVHV